MEQGQRNELWRLEDHPSLSGLILAAVLVATLMGGSRLEAQEPPRKHALLIGINRYAAEIENVPKLRFAVSDAEELKRELEDQGWDARAVVDDEASRRRIIQEFMRLAASVEPQDTVLIYFAGHGLRDKVGREHTYWLTYPSTLSSLPIDALRLSHLMEYVADIPAGRKVVILDHCHSGDVERTAGGGGGGARGADGGVGEVDGGGARGATGPPQVIRNLFPSQQFRHTVTASEASGLVVLGSARNDAYEFDDLGHGMFTYGLLQALRSAEADLDDDGRLSFSELWQYAKGEMQEQAELKGVEQEAIEITQGKNLSDWVDLFEAAASSTEDLTSQADDLRQFLTNLDLEMEDLGLSAEERSGWRRVKGDCFAAIQSWLVAVSADPPQEPDRFSQRVVYELKDLRVMPWLGAEVKKEMLETKVRALQGDGGGQ